MASTILLVDDDSDVREVVRTVLRTRGYLVHEAANGRIGLSMIDDIKPDLVILDIMLPGMSGIEILKVFQQSPLHQEIPVIVLSSVGERTQHPEEYWRQGLRVDEFMAKATFSPEDLLGRVAYLLKRHSYKSLQSEEKPAGEAAPVVPAAAAVDLSGLAPEEVVRHFIESWNVRRFDVEFDCLSEKLTPNLTKPDFVSRRMAKAEEPYERNVRQRLKEVLEVQQEGAKAIVKVLREDTRGARAIARREIYTLEQTESGWKIANVKVSNS